MGGINLDSKFLKLFSSVFLVLFIFSFSAEAAKEKDKAKVSHKSNCRYCEKYEKIKDWPEDVRPAGYCLCFNKFMVMSG